MLEKLMQSIFHRVAALLSAKWTGDVVLCIVIRDGGVRDCELQVKEKLKVTVGK